MRNLNCTCDNCKHVKKQRDRALSHIVGKPGRAEDIVDVWNDTLTLFPCLLPALPRTA